MDSQTIIMLEKVKLLTHRIKKILEGSKICIVESDNENTLFNTISGVSSSNAVVLMDLDLDQKQAIDLLIETRKRVKTAPIIIMTSENKKKFFIEAMLQGATDFIIKPFTDQLFMEKINKYLNPSSSGINEIVTLDLNQYLKGELRKAEKGKYPLSLMFMYFDSHSNDKLSSHKMNNFIFNHMKELFWDTDLFVRFATEHSIGIFPFCDKESTIILRQKIDAKFYELRCENPEIEDYSMVCAFISYPFDTDDTSQVFGMFIDRINAQFKGLELPTV